MDSRKIKLINFQNNGKLTEQSKSLQDGNMFFGKDMEKLWAFETTEVVDDERIIGASQGWKIVIRSHRERSLGNIRNRT